MIYVTSDLHGYPLDKFKALLKKAEFTDNDFCFVLGDVIDRGDDGIKTLRWIINQPNFKLILGNHEALMLSCDFVFGEITDKPFASLIGRNLDAYLTWIFNGGQKTINELYSMTEGEKKHISEYLRKSPAYENVSVGNKEFLLTHSGLGRFDKNKKISEYSTIDLIWNRPALKEKYFDNILTVFGHTPTHYYGSEYEGRAIITDTWINIDTGSACGGNPMLLRLDDLKEFYIDEK